jgi:hypothetical protein
LANPAKEREMPEKKLPTGAVMVFERYTTKEQRELYKKIQTRKRSAFDDLFKATIKTIDGKPATMEAILAMHSADRIAALIHIRLEMHGEWVPFGFECSKCNFLNPPKKVSLNGIDYENFPPPVVAADCIATLPRSKKEATWEIPTGKAEKKFSDLAAGSVSVDFGHLMLARGLRLDGVPVADEAIDKIDPEDFEFLLPHFQKNGGLDTSVEADCGSCGKQYKTHFEAIPDFFFPAVARMKA